MRAAIVDLVLVAKGKDKLIQLARPAIQDRNIIEHHTQSGRTEMADIEYLIRSPASIILCLCQ